MSYFTDALSSFTTEAAYKESIRHLHDRGLSIEEIKANCLYPVTDDIIKSVIDDYEKSKSLPKSEYVEDVNEFGKKTFRKVTK